MAENKDVFGNQVPEGNVDSFVPRKAKEWFSPKSTSFTSGEESGQENAPFQSSDASQPEPAPVSAVEKPIPQLAPSEATEDLKMHSSLLEAEKTGPYSANPEPSEVTPESEEVPYEADENVHPEAALPQDGQSMDEEGTVQPAPERTASQKTATEKAPMKERLKDWTPGPKFPNQLTIARICMIPLFVILLLWVPKPAGNILSMIVFIVASLTDTLDGHIARKYHYVTTFGKFMDPLADKLLVCSALICLVDLGRIESWIVIIIIAREFIISGFRLVAVEKGVVIAANSWGKIKTVLQMLMVIFMIANFGGFLGAVTQILKWLALLLTIISLASYLYENRGVLQEDA